MKQPQSANSEFWRTLQTGIDERKANGLFRQTAVATPISPTEIERLGRRLVNFGSNDYLSLAWHPQVVGACCLASRQTVSNSNSHPGFGTGVKFGSGASPLVTGFTPGYTRLEESIAAFEGAESAVVFSSGYAANIGTVSALAGSEDVILSDALNHASLIDGCRLSRAKVLVYPHRDVDAIRRMLQPIRELHRFAFIVTDSLFSMDGDLASLVEVEELCQKFDAMAIIDEAHATGVYGKLGRGVCEHLQLDSNRFIRTGTLSKAVGCIGGFVSGNKILCDWIRNFARSWIYSTALPLPVVDSACEAIRLLQGMSQERTTLAKYSLKLRQSIASAGFQTREGDSPIIPIYFADSLEAVKASEQLSNAGFYVPAIRPPTVPSPMLRISLTVSHQPSQLEALLQTLSQVMRNCSKK